MAEVTAGDYALWVQADEERRASAPSATLPPLAPIAEGEIDRSPLTQRERAILNYENARVKLSIAACDFAQRVPDEGGSLLGRRWHGSQKKLLDAADSYAHAQAEMQKIEEAATIDPVDDREECATS